MHRISTVYTETQVSRRSETDSVSTVLLPVRVTPSEADSVRALAWYLGLPYARLFREYAAALRQALYDLGKRPPLRVPTLTAARKAPRVTIKLVVTIEE